MALNPKVLLHKKYGTTACYKTEEVKEAVDNGCPGLVIGQQSRSLYRCCLELPGFSVTSGTFTKKKDAEQAAAKMALEKLAVQTTTNTHTMQETFDELVGHISFLFRNEFPSKCYPLSGHFRAAFHREGSLCGWVPASVIAACDAKVNSLCKSINPETESNPLLSIAIILEAARQSTSLCTSEGKLWIWKQNPCPPEIIPSDSTASIHIEALHIPHSMEKPVEMLTLTVSSREYYLDVIAQKLGVGDCSSVVISRIVNKASSEMRFYFCAPKYPYLTSGSSLEVLSNVKETPNLKSSFNARAYYFSGQNIYGDALLANIGYTWKSMDLFHEDVSLGTYYRFVFLTSITCA